MDADDAAALKAQIAALTAAIQALTERAPTASPQHGTLGDGSLSRLAELFEASWARGASWIPSRRSTMKPARVYFGDKPARLIVRQDWIGFRDNVRAETKTLMKRKPEATTLNYEMAVWRSAYRWAVTEGLLVSNPLTTIKPIKAKRHRETEPTPVDVKALRPFIDDEGWAFVKLGFRRGLRAIEARRIEWRNVDLDKGRLSFLEAKSHKWRSIRIPSDVCAALKAIRPDVPPRFVFESQRRRGQPVHATTLWFKFRDAADKAGLIAAHGDRRVVFHDTRHGFTSGMARKVPIAAAMRMSRHSGYRSAQRYIHVNEDDLETAYERLEEAESGDASTEHVGSCTVTGE